MPEAPEIIVAVAGSIAAYKAADVVSSLRKRGAGVTVLMTPNATRFAAPLALKALSGRPVGIDLFDEPAEWGVGHITLAKRARCMVVVGATADLIARLAAGMADDFVTTCALACRCPLLLAPAMNTAMWEHPATRANLALLERRGARLVAPGVGVLACGDVGVGKLADPAAIADEAWRIASGRPSTGSGQAPLLKGGKPSSLLGRPVLITAGPTREALDPVRFLSNPSSGRMGYALAKAFVGAGAKVTLVSGPVELEAPEGVTLVKVTTALQMRAAVMARVKACRIFVAAAAVSDFRPAQAAGRKVKKGGAPRLLRLAANPDILKQVSARKGSRLLVGFAAETEDLMKNAQAKLKAKRLDLMVANLVGRPGTGFAAEENEVVLLAPGREPRPLPRMPKTELAGLIVESVAGLLGSPKGARA